ncbi:MAG TPA: glycosyltransferase 87 family protein [Pseudonocardiaceae bacterium]|nr:glycosyltransferase 87 family protein [Pseudonocardiaceae bacterium]
MLLGFAVFAAAFALTTSNPVHHLWAPYAAVSYAIGALAMVAHRVCPTLDPLARRQKLVIMLLVLGTTAIPLASQVMHGIANPEIAVLRESADRWLRTGTPFPAEAELLSRGRDVNAYNVYLPLLTVFGLPSALFGHSPITDPRVYLTLVSYTIFLCLSRRATWPVMLFLTSPWVALDLVCGATDIPVLGFILLTLVLVGRGRFGWTGAAMGLAAGLKTLAWPALPITLLLAWAQGRWRGLAQSLAMAGAVLAVVLGLPVLADPAAFVVNAIKLPLGLLPVKLTAQSPLPGYLLSQTGSLGNALALALLCGAALAIGGYALRWPPRDAVTAARVIAAGLLALMLLAPATRFGYLVYPLGLLLLPVLTGAIADPSPKAPYQWAQPSAAGERLPQPFRLVPRSKRKYRLVVPGER